MLQCSESNLFVCILSIFLFFFFFFFFFCIRIYCFFLMGWTEMETEGKKRVLTWYVWIVWFQLLLFALFVGGSRYLYFRKVIVFQIVVVMLLGDLWWIQMENGLICYLLAIAHFLLHSQEERSQDSWQGDMLECGFSHYLLSILLCSNSWKPRPPILWTSIFNRNPHSTLLGNFILTCFQKEPLLPYTRTLSM